MKIIVLTALFEPESEAVIIDRSRNAPQNSVVVFQRNLVSGLRCSDEELIHINYIPLGSFINYSSIFNSKSIKSKSKRQNIFYINYINLPVIKQITVAFKTLFALQRECTQNKNNVIVMYDLLTPYLFALKLFRYIRKDIPIFTVLADLPNEYGYIKKDKYIMGAIRRAHGHFQLKCLANFFSGYIVLTEFMGKLPYLASKPYIVMEGFSDCNEINRLGVKNYIITPYILYTGSINHQYGIEDLINSFLLAEINDLYLYICGDGDYKEELTRIVGLYNKIVYLGTVNHEQALELQVNATALVNPRKNIGNYTKYSFPSKTIEYLCSGVPLIAYRLDGIPCEYYDYIIVPDDLTDIALAETIKKVVNLDDAARLRINEKSKNFMSRYKTPAYQCSRIISFLKNNTYKPMPSDEL